MVITWMSGQRSSNRVRVAIFLIARAPAERKAVAHGRATPATVRVLLSGVGDEDVLRARADRVFCRHPDNRRGHEGCHARQSTPKRRKF